MQFSLKEFPDQLRTLFKHMSKGKLMVLGLLVAGTLISLIMLVSWTGKTEYLPLYANLSPEDAGQIMAALKERKIPYRLSGNGSVIQIPADKLYETRIELASKGLPQGAGVGFELFDNTKLGMTEFAQNVNYQRALQGELSRTINGLVEVESSRVHIVMSRKSLFLDDEQPATASVILNLARGKWLNKSQVQGIVHLISSSVPRLEPQNVTIVDNNGKLLAGLEDENAPGSITSDQLEFQEKKEHSLENRIKSMLESVLGQDKAIVRVSCDLDFVQQEKTEEMFFPENQVVRSEQTFNERSDKAAANPSGIPGLAANIVKDKTATGKTKAAGSIYQKQDNTRNYEIGKMTSRQIMPVGKLKRLSVAVVVDGTYKRVLNEEGPEAVEEIQYVPRSEAEMAKLENIVKRAVNYDETRGDKVEVVNISFAGQKPGTEAPPSRGLFERLADNAGALKYIASAFLLMLSFLFVIRPLVRWLTASPLEDYQLIEQLPKTISELEKQYSRSEDGLPFTGRAAQLIRQDQENTTRLMQDWLKES